LFANYSDPLPHIAAAPCGAGNHDQDSALRIALGADDRGAVVP